MSAVRSVQPARLLDRLEAPQDTSSLIIPTTLYELITALQDVTEPGEDHLVVATVAQLVRAGRLTRSAQPPYLPAPGRARARQATANTAPGTPD